MSDNAPAAGPGLAHIEQGRGAPVVLLHAFPLSGAMWRATLDRFAPSARVLAPDLPGFGRSPRLTPPSIAGMAAGVLAWLDRLGLGEPIVLGGLSMGGYVAFEVLRQAPRRVRALGLFSTRAEADAPEQRAARAALITRIRGQGVAAALSGMPPKLLGGTTLRDQPMLVEQVQRWVGEAGADAVTDALQAMADRCDATDLLPRVSCPALVIAGAEDSLIPAAAAEGMAQRIPRATLAVLPAAGHLANLEQPAAFHDALGRFLGVLVA